MKAKFPLKGTAVTSIMMLLILPSSLIFQLSFATVYPEAAAPVGLSPPTPTTMSTPISGLHVGQQVIVLTGVTNREKVDRPFVVLTEVFDFEDITESIGIVGGIAKAGEPVKVGVSWTPEHSGNYRLKSFAISEFETPMILASPSESIVTIA